MTEPVLKSYLKFLSKIGHKQTHAYMGIDIRDFGVLSDFYSDEEILEVTRMTEYGLFLFTGNEEFTNKSLSLLSPFIISELEIYSDLLKSNLKIIVLKIDNQSFILLIQVSLLAVFNLG